MARKETAPTSREERVIVATAERLQSWWRLASSAIMVAWSRSWAVDFRLWVRVPPWWFGVSVTARGGKVPRSGSGPLARFSLLG